MPFVTANAWMLIYNLDMLLLLSEAETQLDSTRCYYAEEVSSCQKISGGHIYVGELD